MRCGSSGQEPAAAGSGAGEEAEAPRTIEDEGL